MSDKDRKGQPADLQDQVSSAKAKAVFDNVEQEKLNVAHDILKRPDLFAETFIKAAETQTNIKNHIRKEIEESLTLDPTTRNALKGLIKEQFKDDWRVFIRSTGGKIAFGLWSIFLIVLGAWLAYIWQ